MERVEQRLRLRLERWFAERARAVSKQVFERLPDAGKVGPPPDAAAYGRELPSQIRRRARALAAARRRALYDSGQTVADFYAGGAAKALGDLAGGDAGRGDAGDTGKVRRDAFLYLDPRGDED